MALVNSGTFSPSQTEFFYIPPCRRSLHVPAVRPFTFPHARKVWWLDTLFSGTPPEDSGGGETPAHMTQTFLLIRYFGSLYPGLGRGIYRRAL
jgi:hypothetical protein